MTPISTLGFLVESGKITIKVEEQNAENNNSAMIGSG
jgi:hypothetical protein